MNYEEKLRLAKEALDSGSYDKETIEYIFPELRESEDERIRKEMIDFMSSQLKSLMPPCPSNETLKTWIALLEKQGEKKSILDNALKEAFGKSRKDYSLEEKKEASDYSESIIPTSIAYGESEEEYMLHKIIEAAFIEGQNHKQKPTDKVEPKFKVGDTIRRKGSMAKHTIESISGEYYHSKGWRLFIGCDEDYELVEQKPAWSEEDEVGLADAMWAIEQARTIVKDENDIGNLWYAEKWLQSLKERMKGE